jgi:thiol-disulfide isomerase/thioredoxin/YHS domain-containing protein
MLSISRRLFLFAAIGSLASQTLAQGPPNYATPPRSMASPAAGQEAIRWNSNLQSAQQLAAQTNRLVVVHFWADWCSSCLKMQRTTFNQPGLAQTIEAQFVPVKLNYDENNDVAAHYGVQRLPTDLVLTPQGQLVGRFEGALSAQAYAAQLTSIAQKVRGPADPAQGVGNNAVAANVGAAQIGGAPQYRYSDQAQAPSPGAQPAQAPVQPMYGANVAAPDVSRSTGENPYQRAALPQQPGPALGAMNSQPPVNHQPVYNQQPVADQQQAWQGYGMAPPRPRQQQPTQPQQQFAASPQQPGPAHGVVNPQPPVNQQPGYNQQPAYSQQPAANQQQPWQGYGMAPPRPRQQQTQQQTEQPRQAEQSSASGPDVVNRDAMNVAARPEYPANNQAPLNAENPPTQTANQQQPPANGQAAAQPNGGQSAQADAPAPLGLGGFCPVTLAEQVKWVKGDPRWGVVHRGRTYLFAGQREMEAFWATPDRFSPVASGYDPVAAIDQGRWIDGQISIGVQFKGRVYLFHSEESYKQFTRQPERYAAEIHQAVQRSHTWR